MNDAKLKTANHDIFLSEYEKCHADLSRFCHSMTGHADSAKDLISETVLAAMEGFEKLRDRKAFKFFLFGIASRIHKRSFRHQKFHGVYNADTAELVPDHHSNAEASADLGLLHAALQHLSEEQRETIVLFEINGFKLEEIAEMHQASLSAVKLRLSRGRERLAKILREPALAKKRKKNGISPSAQPSANIIKATTHE